MNKRTRAAGIAAAFAWTSLVAVADVCDDAIDSASSFADRYEKLRSLNVGEVKRVVAALCEAEEADRQNVARDAGERLEREVGKEYSSLRDHRSKALELMKAVQSDARCKSKESALRDRESRMTETWDRIERMRSNGVLGGNNPVASLMVRMGKEAHDAYQRNSSNCTVYEWSVGGGRADCINRSSCEVIELKPNNSRSISAGRGQARAYTEVLNKSADEFNKLVDKERGFAECKGRFRWKVACYQFCPDVGDDGALRSGSVGWGTCDSQ